MDFRGRQGIGVLRWSDPSLLFLEFPYLSIVIASIIYSFVYLKFIGFIKPVPVAA